MTGKTRCRYVPAIQRKFGFIVLRNAERAPLKSVHRMALRTIRRPGIADELPLVVVGMAGGTSIVGQRLGQAFGDVALPAIHYFVFSLEGEACQIMVETFHFSNLPEGVFIMTINAVVAKFTFMDIFVAGSTVLRFYAEPILKNGQRRGG